jgi:arylsulfatase A
MPVGIVIRSIFAVVTLILFSSDNGPHQEGGHRHDFFDSNGPYRGMKRNLTEGGIREPFIARWKGTIEPGRQSDHVSAFQDILPTLCAVAGAEAPACDGISLLPTLLGKDGQDEHDYLYWEFHREGQGTDRHPSGPLEINRHL